MRCEEVGVAGAPSDIGALAGLLDRRLRIAHLERHPALDHGQVPMLSALGPPLRVEARALEPPGSHRRLPRVECSTRSRTAMHAPRASSPSATYAEYAQRG